MNTEALYLLVNEAIREAERLEDKGETSAGDAYLTLSIIEDLIADSVPTTSVEGAVAQRGAVRAALRAGRVDRAGELVRRYSAQLEPGDALRQELQDMLPVLHRRMAPSQVSHDAPKTSKRRRTSRELDEIGVLAAILLYEEGRSVQSALGRIEEIGYPVNSTAELRRLVVRAMDKSLVRVHVDVRTVARARPDLSDRLARVAGLRRAVVAEVRGDAPDHDRDARVGYVGAQHLRDVLRPEDRVGIGSGRIISRAIFEFGQLFPSTPPYDRVEIYSLTGRASLPTSDDREDRVDADDNAGQLAQTLGVGREGISGVTPVYLPMFLGTERDRIVAVVAPHLLEVPSPSASGEPTLRLDISIYGCRVFTRTHYLARSAGSVGQPIRPELNELEQVVWPGAPSAVIELCGNYLVGDVSSELRPTVERIVAKLRQHVVAVDPTILGRSAERILFASGAGSLPAIRAALTQANGMRPTTLVTDQIVADALLAEWQ